jgi:ferric-dicitrate binding protein FerR (iron transport regulator)
MELFWELLSKKFCGESTEAELKQLDEITSSYPDLKNTADTLFLFWHHSLPFENEQAVLDFEKHMERMKNAGIKISSNEYAVPVTSHITKARRLKRGLWLSLSGIAAAIAVFLILKNFTGIFKSSVEKNLPVSQVATKPGSKTQLQLPDGSTIWLNASSNLTYDRNFGKNFREVNLVGEAFFDVVKDPPHPFIIHTKAMDVKVLGTQFNVKAYPNDATTETSLIRGSVELTVKNKERDKYYLKPNQKIVVANNAVLDVAVKKQIQSKPIFSIEHLNYEKHDSTIIETSWIENKLIFQQNETFKEIAVKMERWYGVHINFTSKKVEHYIPFVTFTTETISQALDELKEGLKFSYQINGNQITINE